MGLFFIDTGTGQVATLRQLVEAGIADGPTPERPWHRIQGPSDASTLWYAVLRKRARPRTGGRAASSRRGAGRPAENSHIYIGALAIRHQPHHASLLGDGWEEVAVGDIGVTGVLSDSILEGSGDQAM